jgi:pantoate--beta-alanine ligase
MVNDLNMEILIKSKPIVREKDGLAMSSRNRYLSATDRSSARSLSQALESAQASISKGERSAENIRTEIRKKIELNNRIKVDYISVCDPDNFKEQSKIGPKTLIALAVRIGSVRLIDNRFIERV